MTHTGVLPVNLKGVRADNLLKSVRVGVSAEEVQELEERRKKCALTALFESRDVARTRAYVHELLSCLQREGIFPPSQDKVDEHVYEQTDVEKARTLVRDVCAAGNLPAMFTLLLTGLRISAMFRQVFCPLPSPLMERRFLVNPQKLEFFVFGRRPGLIRLLTSLLLARHESPEHFVSVVMTEWEQLAPWDDYETWGSMSTNQPGAGIVDARKRLRLTAAGEANEHAMLEAAAADPAALEY